jgi:hypothetical protein
MKNKNILMWCVVLFLSLFLVSNVCLGQDEEQERKREAIRKADEGSKKADEGGKKAEMQPRKAAPNVSVDTSTLKEHLSSSDVQKKLPKSKVGILNHKQRLFVCQGSSNVIDAVCDDEDIAGYGQWCVRCTIPDEKTQQFIDDVSCPEEGFHMAVITSYGFTCHNRLKNTDDDSPIVSFQCPDGYEKNHELQIAGPTEHLHGTNCALMSLNYEIKGIHDKGMKGPYGYGGWRWSPTAYSFDNLVEKEFGTHKSYKSPVVVCRPVQ